MNLNKILKIIEQRKKFSDEKNSYVAMMKKKGTNYVLKKIGEESAEVIIAAKEKNKKDLIHEVADLLFHLLVLLNFEGISLEEIEKELLKRHQQKAKIEK